MNGININDLRCSRGSICALCVKLKGDCGNIKFEAQNNIIFNCSGYQAKPQTVEDAALSYAIKHVFCKPLTAEWVDAFKAGSEWQKNEARDLLMRAKRELDNLTVYYTIPDESGNQKDASEHLQLKIDMSSFLYPLK